MKKKTSKFPKLPGWKHHIEGGKDVWLCPQGGWDLDPRIIHAPKNYEGRESFHWHISGGAVGGARTLAKAAKAALDTAIWDVTRKMLPLKKQLDKLENARERIPE